MRFGWRKRSTSRSIISLTTAWMPSLLSRPITSRPKSAGCSTIAQKIGYGEVLTLLENIRFLGYEVAMSRLVGGKPVIEIEKEVAEIAAGRRQSATCRQPCPSASSASAHGLSSRR